MGKAAKSNQKLGKQKVEIHFSFHNEQLQRMALPCCHARGQDDSNLIPESLA
jgi:hypothetical protein